MKTFKEFIQEQEARLTETGTDSSCVAQFHRIVMPMVTRQYPPDDGVQEDPFFKKLKKQDGKFKLVK